MVSSDAFTGRRTPGASPRSRRWPTSHSQTVRFASCKARSVRKFSRLSPPSRAARKSRTTFDHALSRGEVPLPKLRRTLGWIFVGTVNGAVLGAILGLCFGWSTVGCNEPGNEAAREAAIYGTILGGMIGVLTGCVCEARGRSPRRLVVPTAFV